MRTRLAALTALVLLVLAWLPADAQDPSVFRSGVDLVNVTATVTDADGRFVPDLRRDDFTVLEDGLPQEIAYFNGDRVPVSLGILLDASGSMTPDKMAAARRAITRFITDLLGPDDELFLAQFASRPQLLQEWTTDRGAIRRALDRVDATGGTALYDAIAQMLPLAAKGHNRKKALLVISDGNDTGSDTGIVAVRQAIREGEVLVYALGVDGTTSDRLREARPTQPRLPFPVPGPMGPLGPGGRRPGGRPGFPFPQIVRGPRAWGAGLPGERVNGDVLHQITDDTGGRTEIVKGFGGLDDATARIADELGRQYTLGYPGAARRDGRWHTIQVQVPGRRVTVRARRGYIAS